MRHEDNTLNHHLSLGPGNIRNLLFNIFSPNISVKYLLINSLVQFVILGSTMFIIKFFDFPNFLKYIILIIEIIGTLFIEKEVEKLRVHS